MEDWGKWLQLIQQYGPLVGLFVGFTVWQTQQISKLLQQNSTIYEAEIKRLSGVQDRLLTHALGPQPSSTSAPLVEQLRDRTEKLGDKDTSETGGT